MFRHELKFECSVAELELLRNNLSPVMRLDMHGNLEGKYHIRSIYFDDLYDTCFRENEGGTQPREKWRIRAYNTDSSRIVLECKRKEHGLISKTSCPLSGEQYSILLAGCPVDISPEQPALLNRFSLMLQCRRMEPKVIVGYDRTAFIHEEGNVRITFDQNIFSSPDFSAFFGSHILQRPILSKGRALLEVKYDGYLPDHILRVVQLGDMRRIAFSKYYLCRRLGL